MKVAVCLHGYCGTVSTGDMSTSIRGHRHIVERVQLMNELQDDEVDYFVHCWQPDKKSFIDEKYSPKLEHYEEQINFETVAAENGLDQNYFDEGFDRDRTIYNNATIARIMSFYYSRCESLKLKKQHEEENEFIYDWVLTSRFDISCRGGDEVNKIRFETSFDLSQIHVPYWNQMNIGYPDMWLASNSSNMDIYSSIYESCFEDFKKDSTYERALLSGWPDSNLFNVYDFNDPCQFTNEVLKPPHARSMSLMKFPKWRVSDSHLHHKWFFIKNGLYNQTSWV